MIARGFALRSNGKANRRYRSRMKHEPPGTGGSVRVEREVRRGTRRRREIMRSERLKVWKCPVCGDTYADYPGYNEHEICEECGVPYRFEGWRQELD